MEGHKRRKGFYEEKANQSVGVRDNSAFSYVCVALAEETNAAAEVNEGAAEGKEEGKTEPQEAPKEEVDVSQGGIYADALL